MPRGLSVHKGPDEIMNWSNLVLSWWAASSTHIVPLLEGTAFSTSILPVWSTLCYHAVPHQCHSCIPFCVSQCGISPLDFPQFFPGITSCMPGFALLSNNLNLISPLTRLMHSILSFAKHFAHQIFIHLCFSLICGRSRVTVCSILPILGGCRGTWLTNVPVKQSVHMYD